MDLIAMQFYYIGEVDEIIIYGWGKWGQRG